MADRVRYVLDRKAILFQSLEKSDLFSKDEVKAIVKKTTDFEYCIVRPEVTIQEYELYLQYEFSFDQLREIRTKKAIALIQKAAREESRNIDDENQEESEDEDDEDAKMMKMKELRRKKKSAIAQINERKSKGLNLLRKIRHSFIQHIHYIFQRATRRFPYHVSFWESHIAFLQSKESVQLLDNVYGKALALFPKNISFWISAALFEIENKQNFHAARVFLQRGLRVNAASGELWLKYFEIEVWNVLRIAERSKILGSSRGEEDDEDKVKEKNEDADEDERKEDGEEGKKQTAVPLDEETMKKLQETLLVVFKHASTALLRPVQYRKSITDMDNEDEESEEIVVESVSEHQTEHGNQKGLQFVFQMYSLSEELLSSFPLLSTEMKKILVALDPCNEEMWNFLFRFDLLRFTRSTLHSFDKEDQLIEEIFSLLTFAKKFVEDNRSHEGDIVSQELFQLRSLLVLMDFTFSLLSRLKSVSSDGKDEVTENTLGNVFEELYSRLTALELKEEEEEEQEKRWNIQHLKDRCSKKSKLSKSVTSSLQKSLNQLLSFCQPLFPDSKTSLSFDLLPPHRENLLQAIIPTFDRLSLLVQVQWLADLFKLSSGRSFQEVVQLMDEMMKSVIESLTKVANSVRLNHFENQRILSSNDSSFHRLLERFSSLLIFLFQNSDDYRELMMKHRDSLLQVSPILTLTEKSKQFLLFSCDLCSTLSKEEMRWFGEGSQSSDDDDDDEKVGNDDAASEGDKSSQDYVLSLCKTVVLESKIVSEETRKEFLLYLLNHLMNESLSKDFSSSLLPVLNGFYEWFVLQAKRLPHLFSSPLLKEFFGHFIAKVFTVLKEHEQQSCFHEMEKSKSLAVNSSRVLGKRTLFAESLSSVGDQFYYKVLLTVKAFGFLESIESSISLPCSSHLTQLSRSALAQDGGAGDLSLSGKKKSLRTLK